MVEAQLELSIVVPAYDEEARIGDSLRETLSYLADAYPSSEVIVVDDGSSDRTCEIVESFVAEDPRVRLLRQGRNRGKGAAVRRGMLEANGTWLLFMDADLSTPLDQLPVVMEHARQGADVVIGSRGLASSDLRERQPLPREMMGRTFNLIVRTLLLGGFKDTQCGFKLFRREVAREVFSDQTIEGFAFDVEILLLAKDRGYAIREVPVVWRHAENSKVSPVLDAQRMLVDLIKLRARRVLGR